MKFEYDCADDLGECVAYIDVDGNLVMKDDDGDAIFFWSSDDAPSIFGEFDTDFAVKKFYPGDKLTITF